jgi:hypothetical protein
MTKPTGTECCICGHPDESHDSWTGECYAENCTCLCFDGEK